MSERIALLEGDRTTADHRRREAEREAADALATVERLRTSLGGVEAKRTALERAAGEDAKRLAAAEEESARVVREMGRLERELAEGVRRGAEGDVLRRDAEREVATREAEVRHKTMAC